MAAIDIAGIPHPNSDAYYAVPVAQIIEETAPIASRRLQEFILQKKNHKTLPNEMMAACRFIIEQTIGKATQKIFHSGAILTYSDLALAAVALDKGTPRPMLADSMELTKMLPAGKVIDIEPAPARASNGETQVTEGK